MTAAKQLANNFLCILKCTKWELPESPFLNHFFAEPTRIFVRIRLFLSETNKIDFSNKDFAVGRF